jgi:hypothetical protein
MKHPEWFEKLYYATVAQDELPVCCFEDEQAAIREGKSLGLRVVQVSVQFVKDIYNPNKKGV